MAVIAALLLLCSASSVHKRPTHKWKRMARARTVATVKQVIFDKASVLAHNKPLMWGEWIISFRADSLPVLKPYAPVPGYARKAFVITGLNAYSNHNGMAQAEIIYDCMDNYNRWDIDIFKPGLNGREPLYHLSFYITGPTDIVLQK